MHRLDRYIIRQLASAFAFFVLVFAGVVWLTQAVRLIDTVIGSGHGAGTFLTFSVLVLPQVLVIVLPLSAIGAALYALNKLYSDSELVVMMGAGMGPRSLLRPVLIFGAAIALMLGLIMNNLIPVAGASLAERQQAIRSDLANALIVEKQFLHPLKGLTIFVDDTSEAGEMGGLFLNDQRDPARTMTYSADRALLLRDENEARLVMLDGIALAVEAQSGQLSSVQFDRFVFDLSEMLEDSGPRTPRPSEYPVPALLAPTADMLASGRYSRARYVSEGHYKIATPLLAMLYPAMALATLLAGGYRRSGFGRRVIVAVGAALVVQILFFVLRPQVQANAAAWPLMYVPHLVGIAYIAALFWWVDHPHRRVRAA